MRKFKENLIVGYCNYYLMLNMVSFRRKIITEDQYSLLKSISLKEGRSLTEKEKEFIKLLYDEKQLLSKNIVDEFDKQMIDSYKKPRRKIGSITINLTYDCNFKCTYCYQRKFNKKGKFLSIDEIDRIREYVNVYNQKHNESTELKEIVISGGESLLECNIDSINHIIKTFKCNKFKLFTNGVNILKFSDRINFSNFTEIQVSLDGNYDVIQRLNNCRVNVLNDVINGILFLIQKGVKVNIISMVTKESVVYLDKYLDVLRESGLINNNMVSIRFSFVVDYNADKTLDPSFYNLYEYVDIRNKVIKSISGLKNITVDRVYDLNYLTYVLFRMPNERRVGRIAMCKTYDGFPLLFDVEHGVYWCSCVNINQRLGSFDDDPLNLDKNPNFNLLLNRNIYKDAKCINCFYRFVCSAGCPLYTTGCNGDASGHHCGIFNSPEFEEHAEWFLGM